MTEVSVKVAVRVRPLLPKEKLEAEHSCVKILPATNQLVIGKDRSFTFDYVLSSKSSQQDTYDRCVETLVRSCFDGYNATVFAYGQTGSGKTYTVGGGNIASLTEEEFGIIPRALKHMYDHMKANCSRAYTIKVSYLEIYKEELRDLLDLDTSPKDMHIREDESGNTMIMGVSEILCETVEEVMLYLEQGSGFRHTGSTQMNEQSSRSHSVFTVYIEQKWSEDPTQTSDSRQQLKNDESEIILDESADMEHYMCAKFHFVDLAGSERAHRTGNIGDRFKESVHINSGLLALGNVISALGDTKKKVSHIPYRDSKITRLLKDSLGGNAQTLMVCCISPAASSFDESLNALKYANRARNIKNKPIVNRDPQSIRFEEMQTEIKALREELQRQRTSVTGPLSAGLGGRHDDVLHAVQDAGTICELEEKISRLQTEVAHYRMVAEEAYKQLTDARDRNMLSHSQADRLRDWMDLMDEIKNKVPSTLNKDAWENQTIAKLETDLKQCRNDLKSDEEIFAEKSREVNTLQDRVNELESCRSSMLQKVDDTEERLKLQERHLVEKQVLIEELEQKLKEAEQAAVGVSVDLQSGPPTTTRRAVSVPANALNRTPKEEIVRNIHTSPALFSLERVMQGFRARSQLLISRLEEDDDVLQPQFEEDVVHSDEEAEDQGKNFSRNIQHRSTYKVKRPKESKTQVTPGEEMEEDSLRKSQTDDEKLSLRNSGSKLQGSKTFSRGSSIVKADAARLKVATELHRKRLKQTELEVRQSTQQMRDLNINIRMKEQLIKELVKTGRDAQIMNKQYEERIVNLAAEKQSAGQELVELQKAINDTEMKEQQDKAEKDRLQSEFRKKMELARSRISTLQRKQKETERMATITGHADKRVQELQQAVDKMRGQQELLQRRLKEESDRKAKLEREMLKEQQKVAELEVRHEQQRKVLRVKTEEVTAMHRRLRTGSSTSIAVSEEHGKMDEQRRWLDVEMEKVLEQRRQVEQLEKDLEKRQDIIVKKEAMLAERSELEIKKLRSSQLLSKDLLHASSKLEAAERRLEEKGAELAGTPREGAAAVRDELVKLQQNRSHVRQQRELLDERLQQGALLTPQEERRLIELDEAIDALDAAIEYKNEAITMRQQELRRSTMVTHNEDNFVLKLRSLTAADSKSLLSRYFEKVVDMREAERKKDLHCSELEMKLDDQVRVMREMESSLQRVAIETDRRLTHQQQEYERKIQVLVHQLAEAGAGASSGNESETSDVAAEKEAKIQQLEKDLYYYKKTSRDLKKKLREVAGRMFGSEGAENGGDDLTPRDSPANTPRTNRTATPRAPSNPASRPASSKSGVGGSAVGAGGDQRLRDAVPAPAVRISRKDLRRLSDEQVHLRKSQTSVADENLPRDSLDPIPPDKNPWGFP